MSESEELFGEARLQDCLNEAAEKPIKELMAEVNKALSLHVGKAEQSDDITMLTLVYNGQQAKGV